MKPHFKFRHVNEITGTFVILVGVALIAAMLWTARSQHWFRSNVTLRIVLPEAGAAGIRRGSEVYFLGTLVGTVSDVLVEPTGRMEARAKIRRDFFLFVRADSSAVVKKQFGLAGDAYFEIARGKGRPLPEGNAFILCKEEFQSPLESAIEEIRREVLSVLKKTSTGLEAWTKLGTNMGGTQQRLDHLVIRLDNIAAGVEQGKGTAGKLLTDTALTDEAQKLLRQANEAMSGVQLLVTNVNGAVKDIQADAARLPHIADAVADGAKDFPDLVLQTQVSMRELERLIEAIQRHWLLRKYVNKTNPPPLRPLPESPAPARQRTKDLRSPRDSTR